MLLTGQSINMISLFALIMMLGIIVDDSIVVAEHIEYQSELGKSPSEAAYFGAIRMLGPVTAASLTTIAGFAPFFNFRSNWSSYRSNSFSSNKCNNS